MPTLKKKTEENEIKRQTSNNKTNQGKKKKNSMRKMTHRQTTVKGYILKKITFDHLLLPLIPPLRKKKDVTKTKKNTCPLPAIPPTPF